MDPLRLVSRHSPRERQRLPWVPAVTAPGGGGADEIREQVADWTGAWTQAERDDLLDVVQALIAKGAAAELRAAAEDFDANGNSRPLGDPAAAAWHRAANTLRARADELDGTR